MADADRAEAAVAPVAALRAAATALEDAHAAVAALSVPVDRVATVADAYREVVDLFDRFEERATDWDDFEGYVEFREALGRTLAELPEDLPHRAAFETADEQLTTGAVAETLSTSDFAAARETLAPAAECARVREDLAEARATYRTARRRCQAHRAELSDRVDRLARLQRLGEADLDAPVERLREPIDAYNDAVEAAFDRFVREAPAREVLGLAVTAEAYPLVGLSTPPDRLWSYVTEAPAGAKPIDRLLEFAEYSRSKLSHYVDDPRALKAAVATNRTYLRDLDAAPLTVAWPPPPPPRLRWRARELIAVVGRFADDEVVARARTVRELADRPDYDRLRESAVARAELDADERERVRSGAVAADLETAREELTTTTDALTTYPPLTDFERERELAARGLST